MDSVHRLRPSGHANGWRLRLFGVVTLVDVECQQLHRANDVYSKCPAGAAHHSVHSKLGLAARDASFGAARTCSCAPKSSHVIPRRWPQFDLSSRYVLVISHSKQSLPCPSKYESNGDVWDDGRPMWPMNTKKDDLNNK